MIIGFGKENAGAGIIDDQRMILMSVLCKQYMEVFKSSYFGIEELRLL